jgi:hypothetical protein
VFVVITIVSCVVVIVWGGGFCLILLHCSQGPKPTSIVYLFDLP